MRSCVLLLLASVCPALLAQGESAGASRPRIERVGGNVIVVRGSKPTPAAPEKESGEQQAAEGAEAAEPAAEKTEPEAPDLPRKVVSSAEVVLPGAASRSEPVTDTVRRSDGVTEALKTLRNINGREVPYLTDREETLEKTETGEVKERRVQRYDASGNPTQQELTKIETRTLPDGTVETTETLYQETLNGRMEPIERRTKRETTSGDVTRTTSSTQTRSVNGGYETVLREESVKRKIGEDRAEVETTRSARVGSGLAVVAREESKMSKAGAVSTTETTLYERNAATNKLTFAQRKVGKLTEHPDGTQAERVETYGLKTASGATNINASRPVLQEVVNRRTSIGAGGEVRETTEVQQRANANAGGLAAGPSTEVVVHPTADGETRRTEVIEKSVNGRRNATRVIVEKVEK